MTPVLVSRIFLVLVRDEIMVREIVMQEMVDRRFVGLDVRSHFAVLSHNGLDIVQRDALDWKRTHTAPICAALHERYNGTLLALHVSSTAQAAALFLGSDSFLVDFHDAA